MNWGSWDAFLAMGGHGLHVWGSVLGVLGGFGGELAMTWLRRRAVLQALRRQARGRG